MKKIAVLLSLIISFFVAPNSAFASVSYYTASNFDYTNNTLSFDTDPSLCPLL